ncbi:glycosyltransferase family 4 protein, partial [Sulfuricurvum sp.]|uniref:glycosyltransferase family 4 protein n=1 Tax=Sulfuricurvum sp. TaxID=2025608 RepID=UPI0035665C7E
MEPAKRILYYYNMSNSARPETDSGPLTHYQVIKRLLKMHPTWHFYIVCPVGCILPKSSRVTPIFIPFDTYNMNSRMGFDLYNLKDAIKISDYDYDMIYNNQPEISPALFIMLNNHPRITYSIPIINHVHWFVSPDNYMGNAGENMQTCNEPVTHQAIVGLLCGAATGVNSQWAKDFIIKESERFITPEKTEYLRQRIIPTTSGIDTVEIDKYKTEERFDKFTILWNSRLTAYTGATYFFEFLDKMWEEGYHNFQVICTNVVYMVFADKRISKYPYVKVMDHMATPDYLNLIWKVDCGVFMHIGWGAWSLATLELMTCGKPILAIDGRSAPELLGKDYPLFFAKATEDKDAYKGFRRKLLSMINDKEMCKKVGEKNRERVKSMFDWEKTIFEWDDLILKHCDFDLSNDDSEGKLKLLEYVKKKGSASKRDILNQFGGAISYTRYRKYLLTHGIYDDYTKAEVEYTSTMP